MGTKFKTGDENGQRSKGKLETKTFTRQRFIGHNENTIESVFLRGRV